MRLIENVDFRYTPDPEDPKRFDAVEILLGPYAGVVVRFGMFRFSKHENDDGTITANFEYDFVSLPDIDEAAIRNDRQFNTFLGEVLMACLSHYLEDTLTHDGDGEARIPDSEVD